MAEAEAPKSVNTNEKPKTKKIEPRPARRKMALRSAPLESSSSDRPEINEIYPGTKGRTHGDKKETTPARKATKGVKDLTPKARQPSCAALLRQRV